MPWLPLEPPGPRPRTPACRCWRIFFQFFGDYADWKIYVGYDILYFSVFAAVVGAVPREKWRVAVPMSAVLWCVPFFFTNYNHTIYLTTTYMTSYGDVPAGLVFGGAVAAWLALRQNSAPKWAVLPILALSANIKANTFVLRWWRRAGGCGRVAVCRRRRFQGRSAPPHRIQPCLLCRADGNLLSVECALCRWLVSRSASDSGVGETSAPLSAVVVNGIKILLGQPVEAFTPSARHSSALRWPTWATSSGRVTAS